MKNKATKKLLAVATGAVMLAGACVAGVSSPTMQVEAATGNVNAALRQSFDPCFYANRYPDVKAAYGMNEDALFTHFLKHGMSENRMMNASFDPRAYLLANPDVNSACHGDASKAYEHYVMHGITENRVLGCGVGCNTGNSVENWLKARYDGDEWLWAYYDMYGSFPSWINNDNGQWDERLLEAYIDYYGTLPGQQKYCGWDWNNAYFRVYGNTDPWHIHSGSTGFVPTAVTPVSMPGAAPVAPPVAQPDHIAPPVGPFDGSRVPMGPGHIAPMGYNWLDNSDKEWYEDESAWRNIGAFNNFIDAAENERDDEALGWWMIMNGGI